MTTEPLSSQKKYMKQSLIITFAFLLFTTPLFAQVQESGVLYLWEISEEKVWKSFGDAETQQKYKGEIKDGKPDGLGIRLFLDGTKYMGQFHLMISYLFSSISASKPLTA